VIPIDPPETAADLEWRARALAGRTLGELGRVLGLAVPDEARRGKGFGGRLIEQALGADAGNRPEPDFTGLGIELKTIPVGPDGRPRESTFVCSAPLDGSEPDWQRSRVHHKLADVLWIPVDATGPLATRRIGAPVRWRPDAEQEATLQCDWSELNGMLKLGELWALSARRGKALQLRPKAAGRDATTWALDGEAEWVRAMPLGYYLRARFTAGILAGVR
jgi:DNA mismatch repair protein MutH